MSDANVEVSAEEKARLEKLNSEFLKAKDESSSLPLKTANEDRLEMYSLYKQGTVGDNNTEMPSAFNFERKRMWDAWNKLKGKMKLEDAQQKYIDLVKELLVKYKVQE
ncbi:acyl-CoA-binding protein (ACBP)/diazepam binding inhibitor (DBI)/endozepine (EP) [Coemansia sp. RSA 988]|nr:acyl-CoA-binding protein (ACBP)/diazepam binding inhibitor (DBI)/endozepine (EP) [Coemansia sp. RSA 988]